MSSQTAMSLMSLVEFGLWVALAFLFWGKNLDRRFPAMGAYLVLRVVSTPVLLVLFQGQARHWFNDYAYSCYFFAYWAVYAASAVILFFVCQEVFPPRFRPSPGSRGSEPSPFAGLHWSQPSSACRLSPSSI